MARIPIELGMRVVHTDSRWVGEGTVMRLARRYPDQAPDYALIRFDSVWRRDKWVPCDWLAVVGGIV